MNKSVWAAISAVVVPCVFAQSAAVAQTCGAGLAGAQRIESPGYLVAFRTLPAKIAVGEHFSVEFALCPRGNRPAPGAVTVDARMPEHHHGMNYRPTVRKVAGHYRAEGLMFHMPGRWEIAFDVDDGGKKEHLVRSIVVK